MQPFPGLLMLLWGSGADFTVFPKPLLCFSVRYALGHLLEMKPLVT